MSTSKNRKLATILFADIQGYTALMEADEQEAADLLQKFRQEIESKMEQYNGKVINFYGDGALCLFELSIDALACACELGYVFQESPAVPVRIGVHQGQVVQEQGRVYGTTVNVASRIESMGIPGAVLVSQQVYDTVKRDKAFKFRSLGEFEFKNIQHPIELYALTNAGLVTPLREEMKGKLKDSDSNGNFFQRMWHKKVPQFLIAYLLLTFLTLQILDWAFYQFGISPYWGRIFFTTLIGIIPSLIVYLANRDRIHRNRMKLSEKILFPSNLILVGAALFLLFRGADLSATTTTISFTNADGVTETRNIVKEKFKLNVPIFPFKYISKDSSGYDLAANYHQYVAHYIGLNNFVVNNFNLTGELRRNKANTTAEKISFSRGLNTDYYVDGTIVYDNVEGNIIITPVIHKKTNGAIVNQQEFVGADVFTVSEAASAYVLENIGLQARQIEATNYIPYQDAFSNNLEAISHLNLALTNGPILEELEAAIDLDSTFAFAYFYKAIHLARYSIGALEAKATIDAAMKYRKRLPSYYQMLVLLYKYLIYEEWDKEEALLKIQLEIDPKNDNFNRLLIYNYYNQNKFDEFIDFAKQSFAENPSLLTTFYRLQAALIADKPDELIRLVKAIFPSDGQNSLAFYYTGIAYIHSREYDKAKEQFDKILLISPEQEHFILPLFEVIDYMSKNPNYETYITPWVGDYRESIGEQRLNLSVKNDFSFQRTHNVSGMFRYFTSDSTTYSYVPELGSSFDHIPKYDSLGQISSFTSIQHRANDTDLHWHKFKQDASIWTAETYLREGAYEAAIEELNKAIIRFPAQAYLKNILQHAHFMMNTKEESLNELFNKLVGGYEGVINGEKAKAKIWLQNGFLYYKRPGFARIILRPMDENRFLTLSVYNHIYEINNSEADKPFINLNEYNLEQQVETIQKDWFLEKVDTPK